MGVFVGIDLGTTFSAIAAIDESGHPRIVHNKDGQNVTPSCVLEQGGKYEVGEYARQTWGLGEGLAAARFKRKMGTSHKYIISGQEYTPTELSALVLKKIVQDAESEIGKIDEAVVTIPANYSHEAREATMAAAKAAGLNVKYLINEPTAAALYYAFKSGKQLNGIYAVYDLGGGTFDISIIRAVGHEVEVLSSNGIAKLGGDDFDEAIITIAKKKFLSLGNVESEFEFSKNEAEEIKKGLSSRDKVKSKIGKVQFEITRKEFEESISSLIAQAEMLCESTAEEAKVKLGQITGVFLVGGSSRIPTVRESVKRIFGLEPEISVNVDEVVALGAALYAAYKGNKVLLNPIQIKSVEKISVTEATNKYFGTIIVSDNHEREVKKLTNAILIQKGEKLPYSITKSFYTVHAGQDAVSCRVTESSSLETDPRFVKIVWEGELKLPPGRPEGQEIKVTYSYDLNQIMHCSFSDVATGKENKINLSIADSEGLNIQKVNKFLVE